VTMGADELLTTVVFDLGGVVLEWSPERAFGQVLPAEQVGTFMTKIDFYEWNRRHDGGLQFDLGEQELIEKFPDDAEAVRAYRKHFEHTLSGLVEGTGAIIAELQQRGVRLLALTNWSAETFPVAREKFGLLQRFEEILVSGEERLAKPDPEIFRLIARRYQVRPESCIFIDDSAANVQAADDVGFTGIRFTDAAALRSRLEDLRLLPPRRPIGQPIFHLTEREVWQAAQDGGAFPWSSRNLSYLRRGFVHCSFRSQLPAVAARVYSDLPPEQLIVLELDPDTISPPVVVEQLGPGGGYPHLYGELPIDGVTRVHNWPL
jgi:2-haloacid dehalogenase